MARSYYLRPIGFVGSAGASRVAEARSIAGRSDLGFTQIELIARWPAGIMRRTVPVASATGDQGADSDDGAEISETLRSLSAPRAAFAGLSMDRPRIMGIVNVTPDSFSDGGSYGSVQAAVDHGLRLIEEGADILDVGGESTRPGSDAVALDEECRRVLPVIEGLRARTTAKISVDTRKAHVMRRAAAAGADILNDVSALSHDPESLSVAADSGLPVMLMHAQGDPKTMNDKPRYADVVLDVFDYLEERIAACEAAGILKEKIVVDPGIGFGKHLPHNVAVLHAMSLYHGLGVPVLLGASRKKLIGQLCNVDEPRERVPGSIAAALTAIAQGVQIVRVHDVAATRQAVSVQMAILRGSEVDL